MPYLVGYSTASLTTLAALATTDMVTGYSLQVQDQDAWYHYNSGSSATADGFNIVTPGSGVGRWFRGSRLSGVIWSDSGTPGSTQNGTLTTISSVTIPGSTLQSGDLIEILAYFSGTANAGSKAHNISFGSTTIANRTPTTSPHNTFGRIVACGTNQLFVHSTTTENTPYLSTTETTIAHTFTDPLVVNFRCSGAAATDSIFRGGIVRVLRA